MRTITFDLEQFQLFENRFARGISKGWISDEWLIEAWEDLQPVSIDGPKVHMSGNYGEDE